MTLPHFSANRLRLLKSKQTNILSEGKTGCEEAVYSVSCSTSLERKKRKVAWRGVGERDIHRKPELDFGEDNLLQATNKL